MKNNIKLFGRISLTMLSVGIGLGLTALILMWWVGFAALHEGSPLGESTIESMSSLIALLAIILAAPIVSGIIGIFEGLRESAPVQAVWVGVGCLMGSVLMIVLAAFLLGLGTSGDSGPDALELLTAAGLTSLASAAAGALSTILSE